jgi:hypothetical protein
LRGIVLARHEPDFRSAAKGPLSVEELLAMLGDAKAGAERTRQDAIACYLSAGQGWSEATRYLGGAFADRAKVKGK